MWWSSIISPPSVLTWEEAFGEYLPMLHKRYHKAHRATNYGIDIGTYIHRDAHTHTHIHTGTYTGPLLKCG